MGWKLSLCTDKLTAAPYRSNGVVTVEIHVYVHHRAKEARVYENKQQQQQQ